MSHPFGDIFRSSCYCQPRGQERALPVTLLLASLPFRLQNLLAWNRHSPAVNPSAYPARPAFSLCLDTGQVAEAFPDPLGKVQVITSRTLPAAYKAWYIVEFSVNAIVFLLSHFLVKWNTVSLTWSILHKPTKALFISKNPQNVLLLIFRNFSGVCVMLVGLQLLDHCSQEGPSSLFRTWEVSRMFRLLTYLYHPGSLRDHHGNFPVSFSPPSSISELKPIYYSGLPHLFQNRLRTKEVLFP